MAPENNPTPALADDAVGIDGHDTGLRGWAFGEIDDGRTVEDVVADLAASGWHAAPEPTRQAHPAGPDPSPGPRHGLIGGLADWISKRFQKSPSQ